MSFPDISTFPRSRPGPYELQMGRQISKVLSVFADQIPDAESHQCVADLMATPQHWSAGHAVFREVRKRLLEAMAREDGAHAAQYFLEEACCQAVYNATDPQDAFDSSSPYFVVPAAFQLAHQIGVPVDALVHAVSSNE